MPRLWPARGHDSIVHDTMVHVDVAGMVREYRIGGEVGDRCLDVFHHLQQINGVQPVVGKLVQADATAPQQFASLARGVLTRANSRAGRVASSGLPVRHQQDVDLPARGRQARHRSAATKDFVVRMSCDNEGTLFVSGVLAPPFGRRCELRFC